MPPERIGPYKVGARLGKGGMGEVYRAYDDRLERHVALKVIRSDAIETPEARERFRREARTAAGLSHPAIVQIHDVLEWEGGDCIVMELVEGKTLATLIEEVWVELERALSLARQIADGLAAAHAKGIVHRDLKAENVMISKGEGQTELVKILDFGLARPWLGSEESSLTREGQVLGTYHSMSPEQAQGKPVGPRSDLFSLGALLYHVLSRQAPFRRPTDAQTLTRICIHQPPPVSTANPQVPAALSDLVEQLLQKDPADRPQTAAEVSSTLAAIADEVKSGASFFSSAATAVSPRLRAPGSAATPPTSLGASSGGAVLKTLLLSDLVGSTKMVETLGDEAAAGLSRLHDRAARDLLAQYDGLEIDKTDGFLMLFERPLGAALYAQAYHRVLEELSRQEGIELAARVGIHIGEVMLFENPPEDVARGAKPLEVEGLAKPMAARLMSLAQGRQTLITRGVYDVAKRSAVGAGPAADELRWVAHGPYRFKGVEESLDVFEVGVEGFSPLARPPDSEKVQRVSETSSAGAEDDTVTLGSSVRESVTSFENDLFISYAQVDDLSLTAGQKGWITSFHRALEVRLTQLLGKPPKILRDPKLAGGALSGRPAEELPESAVLISVFSPVYVQSEACTRQLQGFLDASGETIGVRVGTKSRIFKVVKTPVSGDQQPAEVQELLGYEFFFIDPATGRPRELSQDDETEMQRRYWATFNDLAHDVCNMLESLEPAAATAAGDSAVPATAEPAARPAAEPAGVEVYLAETSGDLRQERDAILRFLQQHGHTVHPVARLPLVAGDCETLVRQQLAGCRLSVHLVGRSYGVVPEGTSQSLVALQNELAIERGTEDEKFSRLIWLPPDLATDDERQRSLIESIRTDSRIQLGADILETRLGDLELAIEEKLKRSAAAGEAIFVARTSHDREPEHQALIRLLEAQGHTVLPDAPLPLYARGCEEFLRQQLARCRLSIHLVGERYGVVPENTADSFIALQIKLAHERRSARDDFAQLIWIGPDLATEDERHLRLLDKLRTHPPRAEVLETSFDELQRVVGEKLAPPEDEGPWKTSIEDDGPARVYLICEQRDQDDTADLEDFLFDAGCEVVLPIFDGDETEIREEHEESLKSCDAVVIYYGAGSEPWQRRMLREVKKSNGYGRSKPRPAAAIYVAGPETRQKQRLRSREALVLRQAGDPAKDLAPLLRQIAERGGGASP